MKTLLEGDTYTIMLNSPKQDGDSLVWKCDITIIYERRNGTVKGSADVDDRGSLTLKNVTTAMACTYQAQHWSNKPSHLKSLTTKICVVPKVPVPTLTVVCSSSGEGTLHCEPGGTKGFSSLSWFHNNREMKEKVNPFTPTLHGASDQYRCRLTNDKSKEDEEDSNDVTISCSKPAKCKEKVEGDSHVISVDLPSSDSRSSLIWKCNETVIYSTNGRERASFPLSVDKNGVLLLTKLSAAMSCTYTAEYVIDKRTGRKATKTEALCVLPRAPVPKLTGKCSDTGKVSLHCDPKPPAGFKLSWLINNKEVNDSSNPFLPGPQQTGGKDFYRCRLSSSLSSAESNAVTQPCKYTSE
ncbi:uncharacterized protein LOC134459615 [Engraulis encrasicolus]|uniref:uncharacterized protein LOC134459615 n=1 Tax=Engraulis encrasicolus TaxID=184585 RepID=UPI002FD1E038